MKLIKSIYLIVILFLFNGCYYSQQEQFQYEEWYKRKQDEAKSIFEKIPNDSYHDSF